MRRRADPFYSAKLPVEQGSIDLDALQVICDEFISDNVVEAFVDYDRDTFEQIQKVRVIKDVPDDIEHRAVLLLTSLRGALDKAVHGAASILGTRSERHTNFPFGKDEVSFKRQLASETGPWRGIPIELHDYVLELQPYPMRKGAARGNNLLAAFGKLSNPAKHQNVLMVDVHFAMGIGNGYVDCVNVISRWNDDHSEFEVFRTPFGRPPSFQCQLYPGISFNKAPGMPAKGFIPAMRDVLSMVEGIVFGIEAKTAEALKRRQG
jgi:hypothetical protein